jgi:glycosyltransferase involved in cell wall biosynthesis
MNESLRVGVLSTYAPRACGLATFAADLETALNGLAGIGEVHILRMLDSESGAESNQSVGQSSILTDILQDDLDSYGAAAQKANEVCDVVILQHEFGIFGGEDGMHILRFVEDLRVPLIVTLHTVLPHFTERQKSILVELCEHSDSVTVFTNLAKELLVNDEVVEPWKIKIVPHGAPDVLYSGDRNAARISFEFDDRFVMSTFGLVSPGKGLELAIQALPRILSMVPEALFVIAGRTHPGVHRTEGEAYRRGLVDQISALGLERSVQFIDEFLSVEDISRLLAATDVFVTPYVNLDQIVSGVLTFALAAGCPVVSTDFRYAHEQLAHGAGTIVASRDPLEFANAVLGYALDPVAHDAAREASLDVGASMHWSAVGSDMVELCYQIVGEYSIETTGTSQVLALADCSPAKVAKDNGSGIGLRSVPISSRVNSVGLGLQNGTALEVVGRSHPSLPLFPTLHLRRLVDDTGIIQHATGSVPLLTSGYCVDDVARLIPVANELSSLYPEWGIVAARSIAFVEHATNASLVPGQGMNNFLSWDRRWIDEPHFGDHVGRAAWGLATIAGEGGYSDVVVPLLMRLFEQWPAQPPLHALSYGLLAAASVPSEVSQGLEGQMVSQLLAAHQQSATSTWDWFEPRLRYDFALFPHALIAGGMATNNNESIDVGLRTLRWLDGLCDGEGFFRFPGCFGLGAGQGLAGSGDEQPLEALAMVQAHARAFAVTGDRWHRDRAELAHAWFRGRNRLGASLVDSDGGCYDGLESKGVNRNQGAESTLAYCASLQAYSRLRSKDVKELLVVV